MKPVCQAIQDHFSDYLERSLPFHQREQMEVHLSTCQVCQSALEMTCQLISACEQVPEQDLPPGFEATLREGLQRASSKNKQTFKWMGKDWIKKDWMNIFFPALRPAALWGTVGVLLLSFGLLYHNTNTPSRSDSTPAALSTERLQATQLKSDQEKTDLAYSDQAQAVRISMNKDLVLRIWFDAEEAVHQGRFNIKLPEGIHLVENGAASAVPQIQWVGDLKKGRNLIPLPIRAVSKGSWTITASLEKGLNRREQSIALYVNGA